MKKQQVIIKANYLLLLGLLLMLSGCTQMSEYETDSSAELNGGFEVARNGLPVNWVMYTPNTVKDADFKIVLDKEVFKEGKQSLRFVVDRCSQSGGWKSPGFTNEFSEIGRYKGEGLYKLSFWIKNDTAKFIVSVGWVGAMDGGMSVLIEDSEQISNWKLLEYQIDIPKDKWLRMQLNILGPGTLWIDDIRIERI